MGRGNERVRSCGLTLNRAWTRRHALTDSVEEGWRRACCMAMFLAIGIISVSAHRQHVGATITALISQVNSNLRAHVSKDSSLPPLPDVLPSASRGAGSWSRFRPALFPEQGLRQSGRSPRTSGNVCKRLEKELAGPMTQRRSTQQEKASESGGSTSCGDPSQRLGSVQIGTRWSNRDTAGKNVIVECWEARCGTILQAVDAERMLGTPQAGEQGQTFPRSDVMPSSIIQSRWLELGGQLDPRGEHGQRHEMSGAREIVFV